MSLMVERFLGMYEGPGSVLQTSTAATTKTTLWLQSVPHHSLQCPMAAGHGGAFLKHRTSVVFTVALLLSRVEKKGQFPTTGLAMCTSSPALPSKLLHYSLKATPWVEKETEG